jgi:hypothetical protein
MVVHFVGSSLAICLSVVWWNSFWAHTLLLCAMVTRSISNGSTFYFEVFGERYSSQVRQKIEEGKERRSLDTKQS